MCHVSISFNNQCEQLPPIKEVRPELCGVFSQVLQDVLHRVDKAFQNFFRRVKANQKPGFPRFQGRNRYGSFTYPQAGWSLSSSGPVGQNEKLTLSKIGTIKIKLHREVMGKVKTCTINRDGSQWYVTFAVETDIAPAVNIGPVVGIDMGLENFANLSTGEQIKNPRHFRKGQKALAKVQRRYAKIKHLPRRDLKKIKTLKALQSCHRNVRNRRNDFLHKTSTNIANNYSVIAVENLNIKGLASGMLAKSVNDVGWSYFFAMLGYKVENTGSKLIKVDPRQTSQICPECDAITKKELSERWHSCPCGASMHRDIAAAKVILSRGLAAVRNQSVEAAPL